MFTAFPSQLPWLLTVITSSCFTGRLFSPPFNERRRPVLTQTIPWQALYQKIKVLAASDIDGGVEGRPHRHGKSEERSAAAAREETAATSSDEERVARVVGWAADYMSSDDDDLISNGGPGFSRRASGAMDEEEIEEDRELQLTMRALSLLDANATRPQLLSKRAPDAEEGSQTSEIREELSEEVEVDAHWSSTDELTRRHREGVERAVWCSAELGNTARGRLRGGSRGTHAGILHESGAIDTKPVLPLDLVGRRRSAGEGHSRPHPTPTPSPPHSHLHPRTHTEQNGVRRELGGGGGGGEGGGERGGERGVGGGDGWGVEGGGEGGGGAFRMELRDDDIPQTGEASDDSMLRRQCIKALAPPSTKSPAIGVKELYCMTNRRNLSQSDEAPIFGVGAGDSGDEGGDPEPVPVCADHTHTHTRGVAVVCDECTEGSAAFALCR